MPAACSFLTAYQFSAVSMKHNYFKMPGIGRCILIMAVLQFIVNRVSGQTSGKIIEDLTGSGFEDTRCVITEENCYVSIENHTYRWDVMAISRALDIIASDIDGSLEINLLILDNDMPQKVICVNKTDWKDISTGLIDTGQSSDKISITYHTGKALNNLRKAEVFNRGTRRKFDLVIYPQFYFENTRINQFYETQVNIAPSLEFSLWKGNRFTGQIILPVQNSLGYEGDYVRPGFLTLSQEFRLSDNLSGTVTAGNFAGSVYGISAYLRLYILNGRFNIEMTNGLTGSSHFIDHRWAHTSPDRYTGSFSVSWFWSRFNMELKAGGARYINEDYGLFASCLRHFNETSVGLYAGSGKSGYNGGFFFSVPFFCKRRPNRRMFRVTIPAQYGFSYNAGTEYFYGQSLRTEPNPIYRDRFKWDESIKNMIINLKNYSK
jgi:hypothetical protein